jgi:hypothetical protein
MLFKQPFYKLNNIKNKEEKSHETYEAHCLNTIFVDDDCKLSFDA